MAMENVESANLGINSLMEAAETSLRKPMMPKRRKKSQSFLRYKTINNRPYWYRVWYVYEAGKRIQKQRYLGTRKPRGDRLVR